MALSQKRKSTPTEETSGISHHVEKRRRMRVVGKDKALPIYIVKPEAIDYIQRRLQKSLTDADQIWRELADRLTIYIQDNGLICKKTSEDRERVDSQIAVFAEIEENKNILDIFPQDLRKHVLDGLESSSRLKLRRSCIQTSLPYITQEPQVSSSDQAINPRRSCIQAHSSCVGRASQASTSDGAVVYTANMEKTEGSLMDLGFIKADSDLPISKANLNFEQYLGHVERSTDFSRLKHVLYAVLPPAPGCSKEPLSRISDEADWTITITTQVRLGVTYLKFQYSALTKASAIPLAITMNKKKYERPAVRESIENVEDRLHRKSVNMHPVTVGN